MYNKVDASLNFVEREKQVEKFWKENDIFQKSMDSRKEGETYTFYDGPPTANGKPHIGHVETRAIKDMIPRYQTMKGKFVPRKAGWDTHGLPVELEVEKLLGLNGKEQIEEYGMEPFIKKCKESVWKYKGMWEDFSGTVGFWADMDNPYITYDDNFIESEWWALKTIWDKKLLYKGFKIVPYCPRCGTPLSAQEVAQGYKTVKERSAIVRFKIVGEDAYFLAWTTTPWTLPSNLALCVNPDETYIRVKAADGYTYILAEALADKVLGKLAEEGEKAYEVLETYKGTDLEYKEYEPLFECAGVAATKQHKKAHFVTCDTYVTMSDGTGIVHIAPAFGEDDAKVGRKYDLPFVQFVDGKGELTAETPYAGQFVKDADPNVLKDLDAEGKLFEAPKFEHEYPHCWRCDTPLIYYARESWFIKMTEVKDDLIKNNNTVNWIPDSIGKGRFGDWLENVQDWGISRNRYWGTPLNIWECPDCGKQISIGSRKELAELSGRADAETIELHRPYIDEVTCTCPECKGTMKRVPEVIDCWFDSGAMPFASIIIHLKTKRYLSSSSQLSSFLRLLTRHVDGSTHLWQNQHSSSIRHHTRMLSYLVTFRMKTDRRCLSLRAMLLTHLTHLRKWEQMQSDGDGTSTHLQHHGFQRDLVRMQLWKARESSLEHFGTLTLSISYMQTLMSLILQSTSLISASLQLWISGFFLVLTQQSRLLMTTLVHTRFQRQLELLMSS